MAINTKLSPDEWVDFFVTFSNGNQGREVTLQVFGGDEGAEEQARQGKLLAVDFDPPGKGNDLVISTGVNEESYSHVIKEPVEVWRAQHDDGSIAALEIIDSNGMKTVLGLQ